MLRKTGYRRTSLPAQEQQKPELARREWAELSESTEGPGEPLVALSL